MPSQPGVSRSEHLETASSFERDDGVTRNSSQREQVADMLRDPEEYFAAARQWAKHRAKADVERELSDERRNRKTR